MKLVTWRDCSLVPICPMGCRRVNLSEGLNGVLAHHRDAFCCPLCVSDNPCLKSTVWRQWPRDALHVVVKEGFMPRWKPRATRTTRFMYQMEWWVQFLADCKVNDFVGMDLDDATGFYIFRDDRHDAFHMYLLDSHYDESSSRWPALCLDVPWTGADAEWRDVDLDACFGWYKSWPLEKTVRVDFAKSICTTPWLASRRTSGWSGVRLAFAATIVRKTRHATR